ncbi:MAG: hypothetical protein H6851_15820 [Geminicoccaceae bacterium]|nr:FGGY-family carbohydrate kinase [Geminicoccaceae bacterium]MCB9945073.1 hypothetical protein [Geminicoccaceae bacterium]
MTTAVLDIGKTNVKLVLFDDKGTEIAARSRSNEVIGGDPYPHFDLDGLQRWFIDSFREMPDRQQIGAIVPVTHGASAVLLRDDGMLALPMLDYEHSGPNEVADRFRALCDPFERTFTPDLPDGLTVGRQLFWLQDRFPGDFARVASVLCYPQYWSWWLSGVQASEVTSMGCHSHLWFARERRTSDMVRRLGWEALFPPIRPAFDDLGPLRPELARQTGLSPHCRVFNGIHDSNASLLPYLRHCEPPFAVVSSGTWTINMSIGGELEHLDPARDMIASIDVAARPVPTLRFMGGREYAAIAGEDGLKAGFGGGELRSLIGEGVMALPSFVEGVGPFPAGTGKIIGAQDLSASRRAALATLYSALMVDYSLELLGVEFPVFVDGPFARNDWLVGMLAALRAPQPVHPRPSASGAAAGAFLLTRWEDRPSSPGDIGPTSDPVDLPGLSAYRDLWRERIAGL